ncbi:MAG: ASCH domain-containing protein [Chloroflexota bacterium]
MSVPTAPRTLLGLPVCEFAFPGPLRDELIALVLAGTKVATAGLAAEYAADGDAIPGAGDRGVVIDSDGRPVAIIETTDCSVVQVADVDDEFAIAEGEGFADATDWRIAHERFWRSYLDELRTRLGDPTFEITDSTLVVCERFRLVSRLDPTTGQPMPAASPAMDR